MAPTPLTKKNLQEALRKNGLPSDYLTIIRYEEKGVIPKVAESGENRYYTQEEIDTIVSLVAAHKGK